MNNPATNGHEEPAASETATLKAESRQQALAQVAEAIIFAADDPVPADRIAAVFAEVTGEAAPDETVVEAALEHLNETYAAHNHALRVEVWGGGFRMATAAALAPFAKAFFAQDRAQRLSRSLMETLAIVAYTQPTTRPEIEHVRGVSADYAVRKLLEMGFVDVQGRADSLGRPLLYGTTKHFLEQFGLAGLDDLPTLREIEELLDDPHFSRERAELLDLRKAGEALLEEGREEALDETSQADKEDEEDEG